MRKTAFDTENPHANARTHLGSSGNGPPSRTPGRPARPPPPLSRGTRRGRRRRGTAVRRRLDVRGLQALGGAAGPSVGAVRGHGRRHRGADAGYGPRDGRRPRPAQHVLHRLPGQRAGHLRLLDGLHRRGARRRRDARERSGAVERRCRQPAHPSVVRPLPAHVHRDARPPRGADRGGGRPYDGAAPGRRRGRRSHRSLPGVGGEQHAARRGRPAGSRRARRGVCRRAAARGDPGPGEPSRGQPGSAAGRFGATAGHGHRCAAVGLCVVGRRCDAAGADAAAGDCPTGAPCSAGGSRLGGRRHARQAGGRPRASGGLEAAG